MKESQNRIKEYKGKLPKMKEKVIAVALLLAMSASMLATVSFAWVALSTNPEVTGVNTNIASNGNLEIALATGTWDAYLAPAASQVGDSGLDLLERNLTWGNLINLSDPRYGLSNLVLRPALLNTFGLATKPLYGPVYDANGRVINMNTNFGYSAWDDAMQRFAATDELGVRAITSMTYGESGDATLFNAKLNAIESANNDVQTHYQNIAYEQSYMESLSAMMAGYMVKNVFKKNENLQSLINYSSISGSELDDFVAMYEALIDCHEEQADVFAEVLNLHAELDAKKNGEASYTTVSGADILAMEYNVSSKTAYNSLKNSGYTAASGGFIVEIDQFISDYNLLMTDIVKVKEIRAQVTGTVTWNETSVLTSSDGTTLDTIISHLVDVNACTITGGDYTNLKVGSIGGTAALNLINSGDICQTYITNGVLFRFDNRSGARLKNKDGEPLSLSVSTTILGTRSIKSNVATNAKSNYFDTEKAALENTINNDFGAPDLIANDSYGFAIDFWVRTNAGNSYLTLQGNVLTETELVRATGRDLDGNTVELYTILVEYETENADPNDPLAGKLSASYEVYASTTVDEETGNTVDCWRYADTHGVVSEETLGDQTPREKYNEVEYVIGYEGDNRVWEGDQHSILTVNSTTQGSGSCYVFYSESPVDQARSLELLKSMRVAFVDANGKLLAQAYMDTEHRYETGGKVIVPLVLDEESVSVGTDENGDPIRAITALEQNVATLITAIVYLDGTHLTNDDVLASADIEGQMNIQFGSSAPLYPIDNEALYNSEMYAEAEIEGTSFNYDEDDAMTSHVKVTVTGTQPKTVKAFFIRRINATQGSKEAIFELTDNNGDGVWEGDYTFLYPGTYMLRSVQIDGSDYELKLPEGETDFPTVVVEGFTIESVSYLLDSYVMTDNSSYSGSVTLKFASDDLDKMPASVVGTFLREDGSAVNVVFSYDATQGVWRGRANFVSSGMYTMQYVKLDGQFRELSGGDPDTNPSLGQWGQWFTIDVTLGMRVRVTTEVEPLTMTLENAPESLPVQVQILDNTGKPIVGLGGASLTYAMTAANTMSTPLVWNTVEECYEGKLHVEAGTWKFSHVDVVMGENVNKLVSVNSNAPVFTVIPPEPPKYVTNNGAEIQYVTNGNATVSVTLRDSMAATVYAKFVKVNDSGNPVSGVAPLYVEQYGMTPTIEGGQDAYLYGFVVPSGLWRLEAVSVFNVFDADSNLHALPDDGVNDEEAFETGVVFDVDSTTDKDHAEEVFVQRTVAALYEKDITVSVEYDTNNFTANNASYDSVSKIGYFGKDSSGNVVSPFMTQHTLTSGGITIKIADAENLISRGYFSLSDVNFAYKYGKVDATYGGYTSPSQASTIGTGLPFQTLAFSAKSGSATEFALSTNVIFQYAAKYDPSQITYSMTPKNGSAITKSISCDNKDHGEWSIEVWSVAPTVAITSATSGSSSSSTAASVTATETTVHFVVSTNTTCGITTTNYTQPSVKIKLTGIGNATKASLPFVDSSGGTALLYSTGGSGTSSSGQAPFEWTSDTECTRYVGTYRYQNAGSDSRTIAGTVTATQLVLTYNGAEYIVQLTNSIKINNPD